MKPTILMDVQQGVSVHQYLTGSVQPIYMIIARDTVIRYTHAVTYAIEYVYRSNSNGTRGGHEGVTDTL